MQQREKYLLISFCVVLVFAAIWYWVLPTYQRYVELERSIQDNINRIRTAQTEASQLEDLVEELTKKKRRLKTLRRRFPDEGRFNQFMSTLEEQALRAGIPERKILEFNRGGVNESEEGMVREMTLQASFEGITMGQLTDMLWRFDKMVTMVDVKNFKNFNMRRPEAGGEFQFNVNMNLAVYILDDRIESGSGVET